MGTRWALVCHLHSRPAREVRRRWKMATRPQRALTCSFFSGLLRTRSRPTESRPAMLVKAIESSFVREKQGKTDADERTTTTPPEDTAPIRAAALAAPATAPGTPTRTTTTTAKMATATGSGCTTAAAADAPAAAGAGGLRGCPHDTGARGRPQRRESARQGARP